MDIINGLKNFIFLPPVIVFIYYPNKKYKKAKELLTAHNLF